jgi:hypothetical protein
VSELTGQAELFVTTLHSTLASRKSDFAWAEVAGGYSTSGTEPIIAHLVIRFRSKDDTPSERRVDYPHFTLFGHPVSPEEGWSLFLGLAREETVEIGGGLPPLKFGKCNVSQPERWNSKSYPAFEEWPTDIGVLRGQMDGRLLHELLVTKLGPIYTGPQEAINETTRVHVGWQGFSPTVYLLIPDRRARIGRLKLSTRTVECTVEKGPVHSEGLLLKVYASSVGSTVRVSQPLNAFAAPSRFDVDEPLGTSVLETGFFPNHLIVTLIEKDLDKVLDSREYESSRTLLPSDISIEADAPYISDLIRGGESDRVEFKESFAGGDGWLKTLSAFANGDGGVLFFGVKNDSSVIGLSAPKTSTQVAKEVRDSIEPFPSYCYSEVDLEGKSIVYLEVDGGSDKPYSLRDRGVFVRAQATTRQADRRELLGLSRAALGLS